MIQPIKKTVPEKGSSLFLIKMSNSSHKRMQTPEIKANLDKNKSQRIGQFSCKIALFCQLKH
jgi:hypothetical protein